MLRPKGIKQILESKNASTNSIKRTINAGENKNSSKTFDVWESYADVIKVQEKEANKAKSNEIQ
jgi:hypothetical protein